MIEKKFIGRAEEQAILKEALQSHEPEMIAVIGRRRVGKTFLIKETYKEHLLFEITGLQDSTLEKQLQHFSFTLNQYAKSPIPLQQPKNWLEAFQMLVLYLQNEVENEQKKVVFFDELPWLAAQKSDFLTGLGFFWNSWAVNQNLAVVICGSAASWMIEQVVNNRGGLHNRITKRIFLEPFTLAETQQYLQSRNINLPLYQIVELYMAFGGVPHYLKEVKAGKSPIQNIDEICFSKNGLLRDEFLRLYPSLSQKAKKHISVIRALSEANQGLTYTQIIENTGLSKGGNTSKVLLELEQSGFITAYFPFGKQKKDKLFRLTDEYSLFYLQFIEKNQQGKSDMWKHLSQTQNYKTWSGYAYENICLKHLQNIKKALQIGGIYSQSSAFIKKGTTTEKGTQIDLLIDRNDKVINIVEVKFFNTEFTVSKSYADNLREKIRVFQESTKTKKHIMLTLITTYGLKQNQHSLGLVENVLTLEDLF
jgi:hypothetical protein